jgi:hypothetical protein
VELPESQRQAVGLIGDGDQVNVVGHEAIAQHTHAVTTSLPAKAVEVEPPGSTLVRIYP